MNIFSLRIAFVCVLLACVSRAHLPLSSPLVIPKGEERSFYIVADVEEENATAYSYKGSQNPAVADITSKPNFSQKEFGSWRIKGNEIGTTLITFHWKYARDKSGNEGERDETVLVQVVPAGSSAASNPYHLTVADPVNSRSGEYFGVEALDFNLRGPMPLTFARYYSSSLVADGVAAGALGANRLHSFDWKLTFELPGLRVAVRTDRGRVIRFEKQGLANVWTQVGRMDILFSLLEDASGFSFFSPASQTIWKFDASGKLTSISDGRGNTHTLTYNGLNQLATVADGLGRTLTFTHTNGRITQVADHTGRHVDFTYVGNNLATAADTLAKMTTFAYNGAGLLTSFTRPAGNVPFTQVYTAGKVTQQTERGTDTTTMSYGANSTTITQPGGATMVHEYTPTGELANYTDEGGKAVTVTSDTTGRRSGVSDREGDATGITYHAQSGLPATITNAEGATSTMTYKARVLDKCTFFDLVKVAFPDKTFETFTYDPRGNLLSRTDRAGKKWTSTFNDHGQPLTMTNPTGGVVTMTYDNTGQLLTSRDSATGMTLYAYDNLSRLVSITPPASSNITLAYDARDQVTSVTDERGKTTSFTYDDNGRLVTLTDPNTAQAHFAYDTLDRVLQITDRLGKVSNRAFDARRLLSSVTDRNGNATTFAYDERQRPVTTTDAAGKTWTMQFDDESQLTGAANPLDPPGKVRRNNLGRPVEINDALGHTASMTRDSMQRVTQFADPLGRTTNFTYDKRGDLIGVSEQSGAAAKYTRDALGNVTAIAAPDGGLWKFNYTTEGRLHEMTDPLKQTWHHAYDTRGRLMNVGFPDTVTQEISYDHSNNVTRHLFTGGGGIDFLQFDFYYDNLARLYSADVSGASPITVIFSYDAESRLTNSEQQTVRFAAAYDDGGRLITASHKNGDIVVTYAYDTRNRLTGVSDNVSGATIGFIYDDAGRITSITRGNAFDSTFTYDAAGRLTRLQHGIAIDIKYSLNAVGEITAADTSGTLLPAVQSGGSFTFGKAGQLTTAEYTYDARGRLTAAPGATFEWDKAGRLTNAMGAVLNYNALGEIVTRASGPFDVGLTRFFHHHALGGAPIVAERTEATTTFTRHYIHTPDGTLLYYIDATAANAPFYYHFDHLGSTLALSNAAGAITDNYAHGPYGEDEQHTGPSTQPFTWLGALGVRKEGAFYQMGRRYYDPKTARFLSRDPLPPRLADVKSLNPYAYANQNPLRYVDPRGGRTFVLPHVLDTSGRITNTQSTFDTTNFANYGRGTDCGDSVPVDIFLFGACQGSRDRPVDIVRRNAAKFGGIVHSSASSMVTRNNSAFKVAENASPRPVDRVFFNYNYYEGIRLEDGGGSYGRPIGGEARDVNPGTMIVLLTNMLGANNPAGRAASNDGSYQMLLEADTSSPPIGGEFIGSGPTNLPNIAPATPPTPSAPAPTTPAPASTFDLLDSLNNINRVNPASWILNWHTPFTKP